MMRREKRRFLFAQNPYLFQRPRCFLGGAGFPPRRRVGTKSASLHLSLSIVDNLGSCMDLIYCVCKNIHCINNIAFLIYLLIVPAVVNMLV